MVNTGSRRRPEKALASGEAAGIDDHRRALIIAEVERELVGRVEEVLTGSEHERLALDHVGFVFGQQDVGLGAQYDLTADAPAPPGGQIVERLIGLEFQPRGDPFLVGLRGAGLNADAGGAGFEAGDVDVVGGHAAPGAAGVDQAVAHQRIEHADFEFARLVGVGLVLVDRKRAARIAVLAVEMAAVVGKRGVGKAGDLGAVIIACHAAAGID
jgi:hypothetical protein